jgi:hypothetical protein
MVASVNGSKFYALSFYPVVSQVGDRETVLVTEFKNHRVSEFEIWGATVVCSCPNRELLASVCGPIEKQSETHVTHHLLPHAHAHSLKCRGLPRRLVRCAQTASAVLLISQRLLYIRKSTTHRRSIAEHRRARWIVQIVSGKACVVPAWKS